MATTTTTMTQARRLPGGGRVQDERRSAAEATVRLFGEIDAHDEGALVDHCTAVILDGVRVLTIDAGGLVFADTTLVRVVRRVERHLARVGGSLAVASFGPLERALDLLVADAVG